MSTRQHALRRFLGFVCLLIIVASALALLGWPPTRRFSGQAGVHAMAAGVAVSLVASVLGGLPVLRAERRLETARPGAILGSLAIRLLFVLLAALYLILNDLVDRAPFVAWVGVSYLVLLPVDVLYLLRCNRQPRQAGAPAGRPVGE